VDENDKIMQWLRERWVYARMIVSTELDQEEQRFLSAEFRAQLPLGAGMVGWYESEHAALLAAKAFTIEREREIAEAREDVRRMTSRRDEMKQRCSCEAIMAQPEWFDVWASDERILALVQAQLSTLLVGVRTDADEWKEDGSGLTEEV
jgi:hypothetical protein